ncbi:chondroitin sulfate proteoglycan 5 isoform X2 [Pseudophryne corroboree]|uniref:chondroitin sulfate proteoglycan 5 isoform X2 n=1 Tax=Pseudophryne corroboree TaxID=495146 RepID=UPI003081C676
MDSWLRCWSLAALLCSFPGTGDTAADPTNGTGPMSLSVERDISHKSSAAEILLSLLETGTLDVEKTLSQKTRSGGEDSFLDSKPWRITKAKLPQKKPPRTSLASAGVMASSAAPTGQAGGLPATVSTLEYHPTGINIDNESSICAGCGGETVINERPPSRSLLSERNGGSVESVTNFGWPAEHGTVDWEFRKSLIKGDKPSASESQEDSGSGDPRVKMPSGQVTHSSSLKTEWDLGELLGMATSTPSQTTSTGTNALVNPSTDKAISPDSAEIDHLLQVSRETTLQPPSPSGTEPRSQSPDKPRKEVSFEAGKPQGPLTVLEKMPSQSTVQGAQGSTDIAVVTESRQVDLFPTSVPPNGPPKPNESPSDLIDIDYNDPSDIDDHWPFPHFPDSPFAGGDSTKTLHDKLAPWHKPLHYDDFSPFDDSYFYPTPSFYADEYEEGGIEDDDEEDDLEEAEDLDDEMAAREAGNVLKAATLTPKVRTVMVDEKPTSIQDDLFRGELFPKFHPDVNKDQTQTMSGTNENSTECRSGFVRRNNSCKSLCEIYPTYCFNGGQCYIVEGAGALCRCNTQDYIWHKGLRCESIITDFQVMCVAVGTAALVVLLLFMMTVFFAKKLYLLKTENYKLRKRNRYRTPSELHNDNFSLSTIAEGSHPNEDPNASQKVQDLPKACLKDEEPFNIQNSLSPKLESGKGDPDIVDVNCVLNNLT